MTLPYKWCVKHVWQGQQNTAKFEDYYDAQEYATRWNAFVSPFDSTVCLNGNNSTSQPLSTTEGGEFSASVKTAMSKPTP